MPIPAITIPIQVITMPIPAITIPILAITIRRSRRSRWADLRDHDRALPAATASVPVSPGPNEVVLATGIGLAAMGIGVGIGLLVGSAGNLDDAKAQRDELLQDSTARARCDRPDPDPICKPAALDEASAMANVGLPALVGGAALGVATAIYALAARKKEPPPVRAAVAVPPSGGGLFVRGNW